MTKCFFNLAGSLGYLTISTNGLRSAFFRKRLSEEGLDLTAEQWGVLCQLWNQGQVTQDELGTRLCVEKSSLSRVLDVMERKGLVCRERDPADARRKILVATERTEKLKDPCKNVADQAISEMLRDCDHSEVATCLKVLRQVQKTLKELSQEE